MKYAVLIKTPSNKFRVYATSATEAGARKRHSHAIDALGLDGVALVRVGADIRKNDELDDSCLLDKVSGY